MRAGSITLYNSEGVKLSFRRYDKPWKRNVLIKGWQDLYGRDKFNSFYYQIEPDISESEEVPGLTIKQRRYLQDTSSIFQPIKKAI